MAREPMHYAADFEKREVFFPKDFALSFLVTGKLVVPVKGEDEQESFFDDLYVEIYDDVSQSFKELPGPALDFVVPGTGGLTAREYIKKELEEEGNLAWVTEDVGRIFAPDADGGGIKC
jgi:hypothetical protein